ncbi:hypothetical protein JXC34_02415 [Candidatus Woesearchaeota archaeon]|nr:hypothetical protein [Candidatus Woesearchaeota archaeon]
MVMEKIVGMLHERREELAHQLNHKKKLEIEKQHQIYGAINEIDLFLQTVSYYSQNDNGLDATPIRLVKPPKIQKASFLIIFDKIKSKISNTKTN